jgi:hypothetical protein
VCLEVVNFPVDESRGVEDAVTAMDHVVVERQHHERGIGDDAAQLARVESEIVYRLPLPHRVEARQHVFARQQREVCARNRHAATLARGTV